MPTSLNMKLISFNKAFEIENIIAVILGLFHHNMSKLDQAKWDLNSLTWLNPNNIYIYIYIYEYGSDFFGPWKNGWIQSCESSGQVNFQVDNFLTTHELFILSPFLFFSSIFFFFFGHFYLFNFLYRIVIVIKSIVLYWHAFIEY